MDTANLTSDLHALFRRHKKFWTPYSHLIRQPKQHRFKLPTQTIGNYFANGQSRLWHLLQASISWTLQGIAILSLGLEQEPPIKPLADAIIELQLQLSNVALTYGHVYDRWKNNVSVMIEKKPGLFLLEKLRTINLFKADYDWLLGLVFRLRRRTAPIIGQPMGSLTRKVHRTTRPVQDNVIWNLSTNLHTAWNPWQRCKSLLQYNCHGSCAHDLPKI